MAVHCTISPTSNNSSKTSWVLLSGQAQHGPDRLKKLRAGTDKGRLARTIQHGASRPIGAYIPILVNMNIIGIVVSRSSMNIKVLIVVVPAHN